MPLAAAVEGCFGFTAAWGGELASGPTVNSTLWQRHPDAILLVLVALVLQSGLLLGLLLQRFHRRRAEKSLEESEERMTLATQAAGLGLWVWQANAESGELSPRCRRLCGFGTPHPMGRAAGCTGVDSKVCPMLSAAMANLTVEAPTFEVECPHGEEEGKPCWIASYGRGYFDGHGKLQRLLGVSIDVTPRKLAAKALQEQREQLAHFDRVSMMWQLASSIAHELNQPLGAMLRNTDSAELLLERVPPDIAGAKSALADIRRDNERAGEVIERVRALLKRRQVEPAPQNLPELIREVVSMSQSIALAKNVQLQVELEPDLPLVPGDRVQVQQVLLNLVLNALDALNAGTAPAKKILVRARRLEGWVEILVSDTGPGIAPEHLARLFEPFFTTKQHGLGVGLPISRSIAQAHHGELTAENNPGGGATFRLRLPVRNLDTSPKDTLGLVMKPIPATAAAPETVGP